MSAVCCDIYNCLNSDSNIKRKHRQVIDVGRWRYYADVLAQPRQELQIALLDKQGSIKTVTSNKY